MKQKAIDIVMPVYREEENIEKAISQVEKYVRTPHAILVVWQDEKDPTLPILRRLQKHNKRLRLVKCEEGVGVVSALKAGFLRAKAEIVVIMMADLSDDPRDVDKMVKKINHGYDFICASRYSGKGERVGGPKIKGLLSKIGCITLRFFSGIPTNDATNAFKCFKRDVLSEINIESIGGFELPLELTVKAYVKGKKITEIPTVWREREKGKSKFQLMAWLPQYVRWYLYAILSKKNLTRVGFSFSHAAINK